MAMDATATGGGGGGGGDWFQNLVNFAEAIEDEGIFGLVASAATHVVSEATSNVGRLLAGPFANDDDDDDERYLDVSRAKRDARAEAKRDAPFVLQLAYDISDIVLGAFIPKGSVSKEALFSNRQRAREVKLLITDASSLDEFHDACETECGSLYFDALGSEETGSTASFSSSADSYEECEDPVPETIAVRDASTTYYLDLAMVAGVDQGVAQRLSSEENDAGDMFCCVTDGEAGVDSLNHVLEALVEISLRMAMLDMTVSDDGLNVLNWAPDGHTENILKRFGDSDSAELSEVIESEVLKWTSSLNGNNMLKTQGIVNMPATDLKELLLDSKRAHLFNKNSVHKEDICTLDGVEPGEAKVVKNVLSIPVVGGTVQTLSLTHSRRIGGGGLLIVSLSVSEDRSRPSNSVYSISILRPVQNAEKTELTNIIQSSALPVPNFLMRKVSFSGANDFFTNLRGLCL
ncbi:hypothetical protein ACHAXT_002211 [Thalassiosira profunda]